MKFQDMPYARPEMGIFSSLFNDILKKFNSAISLEEQVTSMKSLIKLRNDFETRAEIAQIRYTQDTRVKEYQDEQDFFDANKPAYYELVNQFYKSILESKFRIELEDKFGKQLFRIAEKTVNTINKEVLDDLQIENKLSTGYTKLLASAKIDFEGEQRNLSGVGKFLSSADRELRKKASKAYFGFFEDNSKELDRIFDELVQTRNRIANRLGYDDYISLGYDRMLRTDYDREKVAQFRDMVQKHIVPVASRLRKMQAEMLGTDNVNYYDENVTFKEGNAEPQGDPEWIIEQAGKMYNELSTETAEFFKFMNENDLMDLVGRPGKAGGGYCTMISNYGAPFIFSNFNGTSADIDVLTHEAGHAFQCYLSKDMSVPEYFFPTYDACEIHSMSMEFFTWPWMDLLFTGKENQYRFSHLLQSFLFIPYGVAVDEFQHEIYANPEMTAADRHLAWKAIEEKYLPHRDFDGIPFAEKGGFWQKQGHIYKSPFYYIDYTLAQLCAFQFLFKAEQDQEKAFRDYVRLCKAGGSMSFLELVDYAGLKSPFDEDMIMHISQMVESRLIIQQAELQGSGSEISK